MEEDRTMMERREIVKLWRSGGAGSLVTLVRAEGSSYRRPGARLLLGRAGGGYAGTISGGCLEAEVVKKAAWLTRAGAATQRYAMSFDDTTEIPFGLGCGGAVTLLFEPVDAPEGEALMRAMEVSLAGRNSTVVSYLPDETRGLRRLVLGADGEVEFQSAGLTAEKIACARGLRPGGAYAGLFVERLEVPQRLFVLGAGDDAKPLVRMAALLGWSVVVADGRVQLAQAERFPEAERVLVLGAGFESDGEGLGCGERDAVILMSHSYEQDREVLMAMLRQGPRYLGLLGSRHRSSLLVAEAAAALGQSVEACCENLFAPVGLNLGGDGPEAIALAIVAEVQAVCQRFTGSPGFTKGPGRLSAAEVRGFVEQGGSSSYLQAQCALDGAGEKR